MYRNIVTMLEGLQGDNGLIALDPIEDKLNILTQEELWDLGACNSAESRWQELADKAGLDNRERVILAHIMEVAFGECVDHNGQVML